MGVPKETSSAKQKTLFSFFGPGQGQSKLASSFPTGTTQSEPKRLAPAVPNPAAKSQIDPKASKAKNESPHVVQPPPVTNSGSRSRVVSVSSITTKDTPQASEIVMGDDNGEVEEEYRPVSVVAALQ